MPFTHTALYGPCTLARMVEVGISAGRTNRISPSGVLRPPQISRMVCFSALAYWKSRREDIGVGRAPPDPHLAGPVDVEPVEIGHLDVEGRNLGAWDERHQNGLVVAGPSSGPVGHPNPGIGAALGQDAVQGAAVPDVHLEPGDRPSLNPGAPEAAVEHALVPAPGHLPQVELDVDGLRVDRAPELAEHQCWIGLDRGSRPSTAPGGRDAGADNGCQEARAQGARPSRTRQRLDGALQKPVNASSPEPVSGRWLPGPGHGKGSWRLPGSRELQSWAARRPKPPRAFPRRSAQGKGRSSGRKTRWRR